jgi:class 3 adenylate cyclase/tetratricopeptide (TPR) repeat protein
LPLDAVFCYKCGTKISDPEITKKEREDASNTNQLEQYIPKELLQRIRNAEKAGGNIENERRIVTMMFCDLEGSTSAAEQLDPEEWAEIMNGAFEYLIKPVYKFEGVLARLMGDAILAFFGAPVAHEDDPERALLTSLEIIEGIEPYLDQIKKQWEIDVNIRIGINTGLVVVGEMGSDMRVEYTAMGDAINLASRMESSAKPGTIQITEYTYKLISPLFEFEDLGPLSVKGRNLPIHTYRVLGRKQIPGRKRGLEGLDSPLIGRNDEFNMLHRRIGDLLRGPGQIISITAEAGIGKTRLVREVYEHLLKEDRILNQIPTNGKILPQEDRVLWLQGASFSYQTNTPYTPFIDLFSKYFDLENEPTNEGKFNLIKEKALGFGISKEVTPFIANLVNVEPTGDDINRIRYLDPPVMRVKTFNAVKVMLQKITVEHPTIIVLDDVHWIDQTSSELTHALFEVCNQNNLTLIMLFRPRKDEISWKLHELAEREFDHRYIRIKLVPLDEDDARFLVFNLLKIEGLTENVRKLILLKSEGNPFFIEEVIRYLIDRNLIERDGEYWKVVSSFEDIEIPDTLASVLTSRLDQLDDDAKRVAQYASIIGREFRFAILDDIYDGEDEVEKALANLERKELIVLKTKQVNQVYYFKHVLTHQAAYTSLLNKKRRELHGKIARCLIKFDEPSGEIARHFYEAMDYENAFPYLIQAADEASHAYSSYEAIEIYTRAKEILGDYSTKEDITRLYIGLGHTYLFLGQVDNAMRTYEEMNDLSRKTNYPQGQILALNQLGFINVIALGDLGKADTLLIEAENMAKSCNFEFGLAENYMIKCNIETATANFENVKDHLEEAASIGEKLSETRPLLYSKTHIANTLVFMTRFDEAKIEAQETKELAIQRGDKEFYSELLAFSIPYCYLRDGEVEKAHQAATEGLNIAQEIGHLGNELTASLTLINIAVLRGNHEEAKHFVPIVVQYSKNIGLSGYIANTLSTQADVHHQTGGIVEEVENYFQEAFSLMGDAAGNFYGGKIWSEYGFFKISQNDPEHAIEYFDRVVNIPTTPMYLFEPIALLGKSIAFLLKGDLVQSDKFIGMAEELIINKKMKYIYPFLYLVKSRYYREKNELNKSIQFLDKTERYASEMGFRPVLDEIKRDRTKSFNNQEIIEAKLEEAK